MGIKVSMGKSKMHNSKETKEEIVKEPLSDAEIQKKLLIRGCFSNSAAVVILLAISWGLDLWSYTGIAVGMQIFVYIFHGLPNRSEEFYDLSGSLTHFAVVVYAAAQGGRSKI